MTTLQNGPTVRPTDTETSTPGQPYRALPGLTETPGRWLHGWQPESAAQWRAGGRQVARVNLAVSVFAEFLGFAVWAIWSIVVPQLPAAGFALTVDQMFWLVSVPSLVGATLRIPYTFAVPRFGGRNWTIVSALLLLVPALGLAWVVNHPQAGFGVLLLVAALAGVGGGNFASSMANISFFYPETEKGKALGLNAAGGNLGTAAVQLAVPLIITAGAGIALDRAGLVFIPFALLAALLAWRLMHNVADAKADARSFAAAIRVRHTWLLSFLYIGTFGSFIGYSGAFPTLLKSQFPEMGLSIAFLGALVGSLARPLGGVLADRMGGGVVTVASFAAMIAGAGGVILGLRAHSFGLFFGAFLWLFVFTGVGNGSIYRMIPAVFSATAADRSPSGLLAAKRTAAGCIGIAGAIGAFGGFLIPRGFALSTTAAGSIVPAIGVFIGAYAVMTAVTWAVYCRRAGALGSGVI
ncbi:MFS transporter [Cumulibacter manganitolerans]|uniref:MFS transporter n=1 Tax=Cumulibacter manganitolerans TaxID=1884992 RepID=UPI001E354575|nr:nitrate/nitrite transporter [Cumulibacter manganitolerans]